MGWVSALRKPLADATAKMCAVALLRFRCAKDLDWLLDA